MKKTIIIFILSLMLFVGCVKDFNRNNPYDPNATNNGGATTVTLTSPIGGTYSGNYRFTALNSPYVVTSATMFNGTNTITIESGVIIKFAGPYQLSLTVATIVANGTSANPIVFTSGRSSPAAGDCGVIDFGYTTGSAPSSPCNVLLNYNKFEYGAGVQVYGQNSQVTNCTFAASESVYNLFECTGTVKNCDFLKSGTSVYIANNSSTLNISYCNISGAIWADTQAGPYNVNYCNLTQGSASILQNSANWTIDGTNNWWGTTNSTTIGNYISGTCKANVTFTPFASSSIATAGPQ